MEPQVKAILIAGVWRSGTGTMARFLSEDIEIKEQKKKQDFIGHEAMGFGGICSGYSWLAHYNIYKFPVEHPDLRDFRFLNVMHLVRDPYDQIPSLIPAIVRHPVLGPWLRELPLIRKDVPINDAELAAGIYLMGTQALIAHGLPILRIEHLKTDHCLNKGSKEYSWATIREGLSSDTVRMVNRIREYLEYE